MSRFIAILLFIGLSYASDVDETLKNAKKVVEDKKAKQEAQQTINQMHEKMDKLIEKWKKRIDYDEKTGKLIIRGNVKDNLKENGDIKIGTGKNMYLSPNDRIYIFISSSIPKNILIEYAKSIDEYKLNNRAVMVIRGCIGGCKHIKPTLKWLSSILHENGKNKKGIPVQIWIDPLLFRMYHISKVPCVVFAENVNTYDIGLSEGLKYNLKNSPEATISCGDWSLEYHLKQIYKKTKNKKIKNILSNIKRGFYHEVMDKQN